MWGTLQEGVFVTKKSTEICQFFRERGAGHVLQGKLTRRVRLLVLLSIFLGRMVVFVGVVAAANGMGRMLPSGRSALTA